jgi:cyanophycin synthetase
MRILNIRTLSGPNYYSHRPVLVMRLDLEDLAEKKGRDITGFPDRLLGLLPSLRHHQCSEGEPCGFVERLRESAHFGDAVEHAALELAALSGIATARGKARLAGPPDTYKVVIEYKAEQATRYLLETAVELVEAALRGEAFPLEERIREARAIAADTELGPSTRSIVEAAERRGIPWLRIGQDSFVQLGYGKNRRFVQAAMSERTSAISVEAAGDKEFTKLLLRRASIPVPRGEVVETEEDAVEALDRIGVPVVVKPLDGRQGLGVSLNISTPEQVKQAFAAARKFSDKVLVEELFVGRNYRALVVGGRMVAASERTPAQVVGDGRRTIAELIGAANEDPARGEGHEKPLTQIKIDEVMTAYLSKAGMSLSHVPPDGETVFLRESINLSTGGTARDVTDIAHPEVVAMCERAARVVGLDICGVDLVLRDIAAPVERSGAGKPGGGIIELNAAPGLRMHLYPSEGKPRDAGAAIIEMLYPAGNDGRIPIFSVTGTNGKTTVTRMIGHALAQSGLTVGMTTTDGIYVGGRRIAEGDMTGPHSARTVLIDPAVEVAVLETARGGIIRRGLGYDWSDVGVMTNIGPDHIGQDGIESVEDILNIKALVAERVRAGGTLVLNADDEHLARMVETGRAREPERKIVYFSLDANNPLLSNHVIAGGTGYYLKDGWIVEAAGSAAYPFIEVSGVPVTMSGAAEFQVANLMAAGAAARAYGLSREQVASSARTFKSDDHNPGRANLYLVKGGYVMVDYGHNPDAFSAICRMAARWHGRSVTGIIGVPGDRDDGLIKEAGRVAARGFHRIIIKEDHDLRGRRKGEVAELLCKAAHAESPATECLIVFDEADALSRELEQIRDGQLIVIFYDKLAPVLEVLKNNGAQPATNITLERAEAGPQVALMGGVRTSQGPRAKSL